MALPIPTTQELADQNLTRLEAALSQSSPLAEKAFLRVLATVEALLGTGLYKLAAERTKQNLAQTATGSDLDLLGAEVNTIRKPAEAAVLTVSLPAVTDTVIPSTTGFIGAANGVRYYLGASAVSVAGIALLTMTADEVGVSGNLQVGDSVTIISPIAGADPVGTVIALANTGAAAETNTAYRARVLFAMRASTGGSNTADYKVWSEGVAGVKQAFPYAGKPHRLGLDSLPGDRTVYVEADISVDPDGVPPTGLLDEVRLALNTDPVTGAARPALGLTDSTLWVEPIVRSAATVELSNFSALAGTTAAVKASIEAALSLYFSALSPYVEGLDLPQDRNDLITDLTVGGIVQAVLTAAGASATRVRFRLATTPYLTSYRIEPGERVKLGSVLYV